MSDEMKGCPYCGEQILGIAMKCKHCQTMLDGSVPYPRGTPAPPGATPYPAGATPAPGAPAAWRQAVGPLEPGTIVREYRIERILGEGGMGEVFLADQTTTGRMVAMKVVVPELTRDPGVRRRFMEEARVMAALDHPNIVTLHTFFEESDRFFLVMKYIDGESLEDRIVRTGPMSVDEAMRVSNAVLAALEYAHTQPQPVVHRDIKPANILLGKDDSVVVMDFGIAKAVGREKLTRTAGIVGTYEYMSPEQIVGDEVGPATDIYCFGITLYKMLTGVVPFPQKTDTGIDCMDGHRHKPVTPLAEFRDGLPNWLPGVLEKALAKAPAARFSSAAAMSAVLKSVPGGEIEGIPMTLPAPATGTETDGGGGIMTPPPTRTGLWVAVALGALALVVALVVGLGSIQGNGPAQRGKNSAHKADEKRPRPKTDSPKSERLESRSQGVPREPAGKAGAEAEAAARDAERKRAEKVREKARAEAEAAALVAERKRAEEVREKARAEAEAAALVAERKRAEEAEERERASAKAHEGMVLIPNLGYWVDKYEASVEGRGVATSVSGRKPRVMITWGDAERACKRAGKTLCPKHIWRSACGGQYDSTYPYGDSYDGLACNGAHNEVGALLPAGGKPKCDGGYPGLFDMSGNVWEWVAEPGIAMGGSYLSGRNGVKCGSQSKPYESGKHRAYIGFRCCTREDTSR